MLAEDKYSDTLDMESTSFIFSATGTEEGTYVEIKQALCKPWELRSWGMLENEHENGSLKELKRSLRSIN